MGLLLKRNLEITRGVNLIAMQEKNRTPKQKELRLMWIKFIVAALFAMLLFYLAMAPMILGLSLPVPGALDPVTNPKNYALAEFVLVLPIIVIGYRLFTDALVSLIRRSPNMDVLVAIAATLAFLFSSYQVLLLLLSDSVAVHSLHFDTTGLIITLMLLGKALALSMKVGPDTTLAQVIRISEEDRSVKDPASKPAHYFVRNYVPVVCVITLVVSAAWYLATTIGGLGLPDGKSSAEFQLLIAISMLVIACPYTIHLATPLSFIAGQRKGAELGILIKSSKCMELTCAVDSIILDKTGTVTAGNPSIADVIPVATARPEDVLSTREAIDASCLSAVHTSAAHTRTAHSHTTHASGSPVMDDFNRALFDLIGDDRAMSHMVGWQKDRLLALVASVEKNSEHPFGQALVKAAEKNSLPLTPADSFMAFPGLGVAATISKQHVLVGNQRLMNQNAIETHHVQSIIEGLIEDGKTPLYIASDNKLIGIVTLADPVKPTSKAAIERMRSMRIEITLLTGDNSITARSIAAKLGIDNVLAEVLPQEKAEEVSRQQSLGKRVAMVGDGINDALAMARADVDITIGSFATVAIENTDITSMHSDIGLIHSDVVLVHSDLMDVCKAIDLSKHTMRIARQNLMWAFTYNVVGIPVAAGLLYLFGGPLLNPIIAAACMSLSFVPVAFNALRLRRYRFG